ISFSASDRAGLKSNLSRSIFIDNTPPEVAISEPVELAYVTQAGAVIGSANDDYFSQYSITIANGHSDDSSNFNELLNSGLSRNDQRLFIFSELPDDGNYRLKLEALDKAGNGSSVVRQIIVDTTPPAQPTLISADVTDSREDILLRWEANTETDLQGYIVFRNGQAISDIVDVLENLDQGLLDGRYTYQVLAIDKAGLRSELSDPLLAVIDITPPVVQILQPRVDRSVNLLVDIVGTAFSENDFKEYRVYVGPSGGGLTNIKTSSVPLRGAELAQWDTTAIASEGEYVIRLEAEDTNGNSASIETVVLVDNIAPAAPQNLTAEISPSDNNDVLVAWEFPSAEADLLGFLLFRNGELANTNEVVLGDLRQFALKQQQFNDQDRPDGKFEYIVYAIDIAGNISTPSNSDDVELDNNAPIAVITSVDDGQGFDQSLYLLAETEDRDVAQVLFQYRQEPNPTWIDIALSQSAPFEHQWDTQALDLGAYELRAVATDVGGRFDQAPTVLSITKRDILAPQKIDGLAISIVGSAGELSWNVSEAEDLAAYNVYRAQCVDCSADDFELVAEGLSITSLEESIVADSAYRYKVTALDNTGNESVDSDQIIGVYGTAEFSLLGAQRFVSLDGLSEFGGQAASLVVTSAGYSLPIDEVVVTYVDKNLQTNTQTVTFDQALIQPIVALELPNSGVTSLTIIARSAQFNTTTRSSVALSLIAYQDPTVPTGLTAECALGQGEQGVNISWDQNPALENVLGFRVFRSGVRIGGDNEFSDTPPAIEDASAFANVGSSPERFLPDSPFSQAWVAGDIDGVEFGQTWQGVREVSSVEFRWRSRDYSAVDIAIDALIDGEYVEVAQSLDQFSSSLAVTLDRPVPTTSIRVRVLRWNSISSSSPGSLQLMTVFAYDLVGSASFADEEVDFFSLDDISEGYDYQLQAVEKYSGVSLLTEPFNVQCDGQNAEPPVGSGNFVIAGQVNGADIVLTWEQIEPDLYYEIYLSNEQYTNEYWDDVFAENRIDLGAFANGTHRFYVIAINEFDDVVDVSNTVELEVNQPLPMAPANLEAIANNTDQTINLAWEVMDGVSAEEFDVYRSDSETSGFEAIANNDGDDFDYTDRNVQQGVSYFYRVVLVDQTDSESEPSNTASAELELVISFSTPIINVPTDQHQAISVTNNVAKVAGLVEQGALVSLLQNGEFVADATRATDVVQINNLLIGLGLDVINVISDSQGQIVLTAENHDTGAIQLWLKRGNTLEPLGDQLSRGDSISFVGPNLVMVNRGDIDELFVYSLDTVTVEPLDLEFPHSKTFISSIEAVNLASKTYVVNAFVPGQGFADYLYSQDTSEFTRLTGSQYSYSPDGKLLAYV
ncbi:MAG: Ig-like domain repeat protein, partial [Arenicella sp.]|nr:Ig-like domain repeat protein [Arenicella sp.]